MGELRILNKEGDTKHIWDPSKDEEVDAAEELYNKLVKEGYTAYKVKATGRKGEKMTKFDPKAGKVILVPRVVGG